MKTHTTIPCAILQHENTIEQHVNIETTTEAIEKASQHGAKLILLQELHTLPYFCQVEDPDLFHFAEPIPGATTQHFATLAKQLNVVLVGSFFEMRAPGLYHNTAVVFDTDGSIAGTYRKMHIPDDPGYYEKFYFTPGDLGFNPIHTSLGKLGVLVCWDQWFPEAARLMCLGGAEALLYPTAIGWDPQDTQEEQQRQRDAWVTVQRGHAISNGIPVLVANRCGYEADPSQQTQGSQFWGNSFACGPQGEILTQADTQPTILYTEIDCKRSETVRRIWPFLRDRRIDDYHALCQRFRD